MPEDNPITFTPRAITKLNKILHSQNSSVALLRISAHGGMNGLHYSMTLDQADPAGDDLVFEISGVKTVLDQGSLDYLSGSSVDYLNDKLGRGFKIFNPKYDLNPEPPPPPPDELVETGSKEDQVLGFAYFDESKRFQLVYINAKGDVAPVEGAAPIGLFAAATPISIAVARAIEEFEDLLNSTKTTELDFQRYFERYPNFLITNEYRNAKPHVAFTSGDRSIIPDFILQPTSALRTCDVLDLKRPNIPLTLPTSEPERATFYAHLTRALGQVKDYQYFLDMHRKEIEMATGLFFYRPRLYVVIGRTTGVNAVTLGAALATVPSDVNVLSYDDVLERAKAKARDLSGWNPVGE